MKQSLGKLARASMIVIGVMLVIAGTITVTEAQQQIVTPDPAELNATAGGAAISFNVIYTTDPAEQRTGGLGLRVHFNASQLTFNGLTNILQDNFLGGGGDQQADTEDLDGDPSTDTFVALAWGVIFGPPWPPTFPATLFTANFTPTAAFEGSNVGFSASSTAQGFAFAPTPVSIAVPPPNSPPVADSQSVSTAAVTAVPITLTGSDPDGDPITFRIVDNPANGTRTGAPPDVTYTPNANFRGPDTFTFRTNDGTANSAPATVTINVTNRRPRADNQTVAARVSQPVDIVLTGRDNDPDNETLTFAIASQPANGTLSGDVPNLTYTSGDGFTGSDSFTFTANDGFDDSTPGTVSINISANTPPVADSQSVDVRAGGSVAITLSGSDADGDALTFTVNDPGRGTLSGEAPNVTYTPNEDAVDGTDSFTFTANDGFVDSTQATVSITIVANSAPVANDQSVSTDAGETVPITLTANDPDGDSLTFTIVDQPGRGSLSGDAPNVEYTPAGDFASGTDTFTFMANDGLLDSNTATVTVSVNPGLRFVTPLDGDVIAGIVATEVETLTGTVKIDYASRQDGGDFTNFSSSTTPPSFTGAFDTEELNGVVDLQAIVTQVIGEDTVTTPSEIISVTVDNANPEAADIHETPNVRSQNLLQDVDNTVVLVNGIRLAIPAGSLAADDRVQVALVSVEPFGTPQGPTGVLFGPDTDQMRVADISLLSGQTPLTYTVTVPYVAGEDVEATDLALYAFNETTSLWERVTNAEPDPTNSFFTADVTTPAVFGVFPTFTEPPPLDVTVDPAADTIRVQIPEDDVPLLSFNVTNNGQEAVVLNQIDLNFNDLSGDADRFSLTLRALDATTERVLGRTTVRGIPDNLSVPFNIRMLTIPPGGTATVDVVLAKARGNNPDAVSAIPASSGFAWLLLTPVVALVLLPRWRRGSSKFTIGLLLVALVCTVVLTACPDDNGQEASFTVVIPAGGIGGQGAISRLPIAVPAAAQPGPQLILQK